MQSFLGACGKIKLYMCVRSIQGRLAQFTQQPLLAVSLSATTTALLARATLWTTEYIGFNHYVYAGGSRWHHAQTGLVLFVLGLLLTRLSKWSVHIMGIGLGLVLDEPNIVLTWFGLAEVPYWHPVTILTSLTSLLTLRIFTAYFSQRKYT